MTSLEMLGVTGERLEELRSMHAAGADADPMIWHLHRLGGCKPGAVVALRIARVMPNAETKERVHEDPAFAQRREQDEAFQEAAWASWSGSERLKTVAA